MLQEIRNAGGETVWGDPTNIGEVVGQKAFDVVLDNNGKDLDTVKYALSLGISFFKCQLLFIRQLLVCPRGSMYCYS